MKTVQVYHCTFAREANGVKITSPFTVRVVAENQERAMEAALAYANAISGDGWEYVDRWPNETAILAEFTYTWPGDGRDGN